MDDREALASSQTGVGQYEEAHPPGDGVDQLGASADGAEEAVAPAPAIEEPPPDEGAAALAALEVSSAPIERTVEVAVPLGVATTIAPSAGRAQPSEDVGHQPSWLIRMRVRLLVAALATLVIAGALGTTYAGLLLDRKNTTITEYEQLVAELTGIRQRLEGQVQDLTV